MPLLRSSAQDRREHHGSHQRFQASSGPCRDRTPATGGHTPVRAAYIAVMSGLGGGSPRNVPAAIAPDIKIPQIGQALYVFALP